MEAGAKARRSGSKERDNLQPELVIALAPKNVNNRLLGGINESNAWRIHLSYGTFDGDANKRWKPAIG
jgi:hypothetical protein